MEYRAKILWGMSLSDIDTELGEIAKTEYEGKVVDRPRMWDLLETKKRYLAAQARLNEQQNKDNRFTEITTEDIYNEIRNEEEKTMSNTFTTGGNTFTTNDKGNYFYMTDADGKKYRIKKSEYERAKREHEAWMEEQKQLDEEIEAIMNGADPDPIPEPEDVEPITDDERQDIEDMMEMAEQENAEDEQEAEAEAEYRAEAVEQTDEEWEAEAEAERKAREDKIVADAKATEDAVNGIVATLTEEKPEKGKKKAKKEKTNKKDQPKAEAKEKAKKTRKSKDIAHEHKDGEVTITLTAKQVDFVLHLSDSCFWEKGLDSILWCDVLVDEIGGQFEGKPMTIGAMISTLCEKGLGIRTKDRLTDETTGKSRKSTTFQLTEKGKEIAKELGLK